MVKFIKLIISLFVAIFLVVGLSLSAINAVLLPKERKEQQAHQKLGNEQRQVTATTAPTPLQITVSFKGGNGCGTYADVSSAVAKFKETQQSVAYVENEVFVPGVVDGKDTLCLVRATFVLREDP